MKLERELIFRMFKKVIDECERVYLRQHGYKDSAINREIRLLRNDNIRYRAQFYNSTSSRKSVKNYKKLLLSEITDRFKIFIRSQSLQLLCKLFERNFFENDLRLIEVVALEVVRRARVHEGCAQKLMQFYKENIKGAIRNLPENLDFVNIEIDGANDDDHDQVCSVHDKVVAGEPIHDEAIPHHSIVGVNGVQDTVDSGVHECVNVLSANDNLVCTGEICCMNCNVPTCRYYPSYKNSLEGLAWHQSIHRLLKIKKKDKNAFLDEMKSITILASKNESKISAIIIYKTKCDLDTAETEPKTVELFETLADVQLRDVILWLYRDDVVSIRLAVNGYLKNGNDMNPRCPVHCIHEPYSIVRSPKDNNLWMVKRTYSRIYKYLPYDEY